MRVVDYPVTTPFGWVEGYPLNLDPNNPNRGYHRGIDYGCPVGTPIVVNGTMIGISGATGAVTGAHVHIGKWNGNTVVNPGIGNGVLFVDAVVSDIGEDDVNGKYVKLQADGYTWVYLHMSNNKLVTVGQKLEGDEMRLPTKDEVNAIYISCCGRSATQAEVENYTQHSFDTCFLEVFNSPEGVAWGNKSRAAVASGNANFVPYSGAQLFTKK